MRSPSFGLLRWTVEMLLRLSTSGSSSPNGREAQIRSSAR